MSHIALVTLVVRDYDEALSFYTDALGFELVEDTDRGDGSRWVVVRPRGTSGTGLLPGARQGRGPARERRGADRRPGRILPAHGGLRG